MKKKLDGLMKWVAAVSMTMFVLGAITGCAEKDQDKSTVKVSVTSVPHAEIMEHIKPELEKEGVKLEILVADDYDVHNRSLSEEEVDANFFQHVPFLDEQVADFGYDIVEFGKIHVEPLGVYSNKYDSLSDLPEGAIISVPNDPSNESRALTLLHNEGLIELEDVTNLKSTIIDIKENPKNFEFQEIDAAMLTRSLEDVDASVINTNFALIADIDPVGDALAIEDSNSPNVNILAIRAGDEDREELIKLKGALMSDSVRDFINEKYEGAVIPVF